MMAKLTNLEKLKVLRYDNRLLHKEICRLSLVNAGLEARVARLELTDNTKPPHPPWVGAIESPWWEKERA